MNKLIRGAGGGKSGGGQGYTPTEDPDSLLSKQYARVLDCICEGEIEGLYEGHKSIFLDDTPLMNSDGTYNFTDVQVDVRLGTQSQEYIPDFSSAESEQSVNVVVSSATSVVRQITDSNVDVARIALAWNRLTYQDPSNGDLRGSSVEYSIELQSNGGGFFPQFLKSDTVTRATIASGVATTVTGTTAFNGQCVWQKSLSPYTVSDAYEWITVTIIYDIEYKLSSSGTWIQLARFQLSEYGDGSTTTTGTSFSKTDLDAGIYDVRVTIVSGSGTITLDYVDALAPSAVGLAQGKTTSRYVRTHEIDLKQTGLDTAPWDIRITRVTADSTESNLVDEFSWASYTEVINSKLSYPNSALVGMKIDAEQFNSIPKRGYEMRLLKVKIPSNYDPFERTYTGIWDGTFSIAWTNNPAWCFYDLITTARYGLGNFIDEAFVNKSALYTIAQYCDELVPDGYGGTEPRFTCNMYLQTREEAYKVITNMASIFRGMVYWHNSLITAVQDSPEEVWTQFSNADVIDGLFNYEGSAAKTRHNVALVSWNDPDNGYELNVEYVEDSEALALSGTIIETEVVALGCTSRGQAHRLGKWLLYTEKYETGIVTFKSGLESTNVYPGKIIRTSDQYKAGVRYGGRILSSTTSTVTLDSPITIVSGTYTISFVLPDGSLIDKTITDAAGTYDTVTISPAFSTEPQRYSLWVVSSDDVSPETWRVISVSEEDKHIYSITAVQYNASKYANVENDVVLEIPSVSTLRNIQAPITDLTFSESLYLAGIDSLGIRGLLSWRGNASSYVVRYTLANENEQSVETRVNNAELLGLYEGDYTFTVVAYNSLGVASSPVSMQATVAGKSANPSDVTNLSASLTGDGVILAWDKVPDLDVRQYELAVGGTSWETATSIDPPPVDNSYFTQQVPAGNTAWWVKALDTTGHFSTNAAVVYTNIALPLTPTLTSEVIDNNVLLKWTDATSTTPIDFYEIRKGATWASAQSVGVISGRFSTVFETVSGTYTYWVAATDLLGNEGAAAYVIATVSQPPDYKLEADRYSDFAGTGGIVRVNCFEEDGRLILPANITETWAEHFTNNSWTSPADQITAGYPIYVQPTPTTAQFSDEFDTGAVIGGSVVQVLYDKVDVAGATSVAITISVKLNSGDAWTDYVGVSSVFTTNFRYVKTTLDFTSSATTDVSYLTFLRTLVSVKQRTDSGTIACLSTDTDAAGDVGTIGAAGTVVLFNLTFLDIDSITVTANSTTPVIAIYDFTDSANPAGFKILLFDTAGTRVSGTATWTARGAA